MFWKAESLLFHLETMFLIELQVLASENGGERKKLTNFHENTGFSNVVLLFTINMCIANFIADEAVIYHITYLSGVLIRLINKS